MEEIEAHFTRYWGKAEWVFHTVIPDRVHIDVHVIPPRPERNSWTLFTTGMSELPMTTPPGHEEFQFAELLLSLPADWKLDSTKRSSNPDEEERWTWPVDWLRQLALMPHEGGTWVASGHTFASDPPERLYSNTKLCGWVLLPPSSVPQVAQSVTLSDGRVVHLYCLHGLHADELKLKLAEGKQALIDALDRAKVSEVLDIKRRSSLQRKRFGFF